MADDTPAAPPVPAALPKPTTWLHYAIVYPTLLLSLGGSVPTVLQALKARRLDTTYARVQLAEEQTALWQANLPCLQQQGTYEVDGPHGIVVKVTVCALTGDTLLRYHVRDVVPIYRWVALPVEKVKK